MAGNRYSLDRRTFTMRDIHALVAYEAVCFRVLSDDFIASKSAHALLHRFCITTPRKRCRRCSAHVFCSLKLFSKRREQFLNSAFRSGPWALPWYLEDEFCLPAALLVWQHQNHIEYY